MKFLSNIFLVVLITGSTVASAQKTLFSVATDLALQRNFKKEQRYWSAGQTVYSNFHLNPKDAVYASFAYFTEGEFNNSVTATAKSALTTPQQINYTNTSKMRIKQISLGYRKYFKGRFDAEEGWNLYGSAGLGLMLGRVENRHSNVIDTNTYLVPVRSGKANFKRLTLDLALGYEYPLGASFYIYVEGRALVPTTDYPSKHIFVNKNAPLVGIASAGLRILFD